MYVLFAYGLCSIKKLILRSITFCDSSGAKSTNLYTVGYIRVTSVLDSSLRQTYWGPVTSILHKGKISINVLGIKARNAIDWRISKFLQSSISTSVGLSNKCSNTSHFARENYCNHNRDSVSARWTMEFATHFLNFQTATLSAQISQENKWINYLLMNGDLCPLKALVNLL